MIITINEQQEQPFISSTKSGRNMTTKDLIITESQPFDSERKMFKTLSHAEDAKVLSTTMPTTLPLPSSPNEKDQAITSSSTRYLIFVLTILENLIFSGIVFGWPALFYILKSEHIFENLCQSFLINNNTIIEHHNVISYQIDPLATNITSTIPMDNNNLASQLLLKVTNLNYVHNLILEFFIQSKKLQTYYILSFSLK